MGKVFCAVCQKRCKGDVLKIEQQFVHHKCFQCTSKPNIDGYGNVSPTVPTECHKNLQQGGFFVREKRFYCPEDYQTDFGVKCQACGFFVEGEVVTVLGKTFHTHCFRCSVCNRLFSSGERTTIVDKVYYCTTCASRVTNGHPTSVHAAGDTPTVRSPSRLHGQPYASRTPDPSWTQDARLVNTLPAGQLHAKIPVSHSRSATYSPPQSNPYMDGQLTVQIHENGCVGTAMGEQKTEATMNHLGPTGDHTMNVDTLLSTTPGQTFSAGSYTLSGSERRICPPGVDYGRHYPMSYIELSDRGLTAIMSSDEVPLLHPHSKSRTNSLAHPTGYPTYSPHRLARRDQTVRHEAVGAPPPPPRISNSRGLSESEVGDSVDSHLNGPVDANHRAMNHRANNAMAHTRTTSSYSITGPRGGTMPPGRPRRDLYVRRRELSPGSTSLSSSNLLGGYQSSRSRGATMVDATDRSRASRNMVHSSSRSTPNVRGKRAESLFQPRPRPERSLSPDSAAAECWAEARRLASFPNARIPDSTSLPAIERFDFPAPPSPAVLLMERRREKRLESKRSKANTLESDTMTPNGTLSGAELTDTELSDLPPKVSAKLHKIDAEIETLKRLGESSGITTAMIQELEARKLTYIRGPDLDPVSASRSPSADTEPTYKTRYDRHMFASPSRDTRRDRRSAHTLCYRMDYSSTGGRSGTIPSFPSTPRPGYTSGILHSRAISLPRQPMHHPGVMMDHTRHSHMTSTPTTDAIRLSSGVRTGGGHGHHTLGQTSLAVGHMGTRDTTTTGTPNTDRLMYGTSGDHTESLHTTMGGLDSQLISPDGMASLATSIPSIDGLTACSGDDTATLAPSGRSGRSTHLSGIGGDYVTKSGTITGLPHSVTGLRPIGAVMRHQQQLWNTRYRSRTHTPIRYGAGGGGLASDSDLSDLDTAPSVQSWLRPTKSQTVKSFKTHPYDELKLGADDRPKGLDRTHLEAYLSSAEFETLFGMSLTAFNRLPEWKRNDLKKRLDLI